MILNANPKGPGYWNLNFSFLTEHEYENEIKTVIGKVTEEYKNDDAVNDYLLWEVIKMKIRENLIIYAKQKKKFFETNILLLEKELEEKDLTSQQKRKIIDLLNTYIKMK